MLITKIAILLSLIILSALFSGIETALMSLSMIKVNALLKQKRKGAKALHRIKQNPHKLIITILIGNNVVNIGAASFATAVFTDLFGSAGVGIATGVMTLLILIFGEITPKTFATQNSERISLIVARPVELISFILTPLSKMFEFISRLMSKILGSKEEKELSEEELRTIVTMGKDEGILTKEAAEIMHNVLAFEGTKVTEIMTPKVDMEMINSEDLLKDIIEFLIKTPFSRYPVYSETRDKIAGILDVDNVLKYAKDNKLDIKAKDIAKPAVFVPESKEIDDLLTEFEGQKMPMVIVVNEYGGVIGLVTVEDILEEIVGEIFDKSKKANIYRRKKDESMSVNADVSIEEFNKEFNLNLKPGRFNTLAGFIAHKLERIPKKGEKINLDGFIMIIENATKQRIKSVRIVKTK